MTRTMTSGRRRRVFKMLAVTASLVVGFSLGEAITRAYFATSRGWSHETERLLMAGEVPPSADFQRCVGQPYLLYVPAPGYRNKYGDVDHNADAFRGRRVPLERVPGIARVLCLGGSTTYGWGVTDASDTFPAQLETLLKASLPRGFTGVEVINGGIPFGSSAELVTHYHFKFHYYRPDVVVIHTGGNDALAAESKFYQPDYSHWRQPMPVRQPLAIWGRRMMSCRLAALPLILLMSGPPRASVTFERPADTPPAVAWHPAARTADGIDLLDDHQLSFSHNITTLVRLARHDGVRPLLVPFRLEPRHSLTASEALAVNRNATILARIAVEQDVAHVPFPDSTISIGNWLDDCHLNVAGCLEKADYLAPHIRALLEGSTPADAD